MPLTRDSSLSSILLIHVLFSATKFPCFFYVLLTFSYSLLEWYSPSTLSSSPDILFSTWCILPVWLFSKFSYWLIECFKSILFHLGFFPAFSSVYIVFQYWVAVITSFSYIFLSLELHAGVYLFKFLNVFIHVFLKPFELFDHVYDFSFKLCAVGESSRQSALENICVGLGSLEQTTFFPDLPYFLCFCGVT